MKIKENKISRCCGAGVKQNIYYGGVPGSYFCDKCHQPCDTIEDALARRGIEEVSDFVPLNTAKLIGLSKKDYKDEESLLQHVSIRALKDCKNEQESFGEICVRCNKCGRFNKDEIRHKIMEEAVIETNRQQKEMVDSVFPKECVDPETLDEDEEKEEVKQKHNWFPLMSDINSTPEETYYWWRCSNCGKETEHLKKSKPKPSEEGCEAIKKGSIFPLSSI